MAPSNTQLARDRTNDFASAVERRRKALESTSGGPGKDGGFQPKSPVRTVGKQSDFAKRASKIGMQIHSTSLKLAKLAQLAKRTSMFDDPEKEIAELTTVIRQDITVLNGAVSELQGMSLGQDSSSRSKQNVDHSSTVVKNLQSKLMDTTKEFQNVLTLRKENVKSHESRRRMFSTTERRGDSGMKSGLGIREPFSPENKAQEGLFLPSPPKGSHQGNDADWASPKFDGGTHQQQTLMASQDNYLESRAEALQNVESTITELGGIFQQLAHLVKEQGEVAIRIDENMDDALLNVDQAQNHLMKYLNRISSNRWLAIKILLVLLVFGLFFVLFVA